MEQIKYSSPVPLLILHERHTPDDADIWRVAVRRKWVTERVNRYSVAARLSGHSVVRYYGNVLHLSMIADQLPITFHDIDPAVLATVPWATHRDIALMRFGELPQPMTGRAFVKPVHVKWFEAKVYNPGDTVTGAPEIDDLIYVQSVTEFIDEVRCFCLDGVILTASLYRINRVVWDQSGIDESLINYDDRIASTPIPGYVADLYSRAKLPRALVIDFGRHLDGSWSLIEFNEPWASGLYFCDPERCFDCIVESQTDGRRAAPIPLR